MSFAGPRARHYRVAASQPPPRQLVGPGSMYGAPPSLADGCYDTQEMQMNSVRASRSLIRASLLEP